MVKLKDSSAETLRLLRMIKTRIEERIPSLIYGEKKYWAYFKSTEKNRNFALFHPQRSQIRLFTNLPINFNNRLEESPSTKSWERAYPSIFLIKSEESINDAVELIIRTYEYDLNR